MYEAHPMLACLTCSPQAYFPKQSFLPDLAHGFEMSLFFFLRMPLTMGQETWSLNTFFIQLLLVIWERTIKWRKKMHIFSVSFS